MDIKVIEKLLEEYTKHFEVKTEGGDSMGGFFEGLTSIIIQLKKIQKSYRNLLWEKNFYKKINKTNYNICKWKVQYYRKN